MEFAGNQLTACARNRSNQLEKMGVKTELIIGEHAKRKDQSE